MSNERLTRGGIEAGVCQLLGLKFPCRSIVWGLTFYTHLVSKEVLLHIAGGCGALLPATVSLCVALGFRPRWLL